MKTDRTERLLNLVLCLLGARVPVGRAAIRNAVPGYESTSSDEAFERMFERDKDELRAMGIPVETVISAAGETEGYRIDSTHYAMPAIAFTAEEITVLGLAARAWTDAILEGAANTAVLKIEATSGEQAFRAEARTIISARPGAGDTELPVLWEAVRARQVVQFPYRGLRDGPVAVRRVEPWGTVRFRGGWYLVGHDLDRQDKRVFRLSRFEGPVRLHGPRGAFPRVDHVDVRSLVETYSPDDETHAAVVRVDEGMGARLRQRASRLDDGSLLVDYAESSHIAGDVCELGACATVISPPELRAEVRDRLHRVADAHAETRP